MAQGVKYRVVGAMLLGGMVTATIPQAKAEDSYEGAGDYRIHLGEVCGRETTPWAPKYLAEEDRNLSCVRERLIHPGDFISLHLKNAVFRNITEGPPSRWWDSVSRPSGKTVGEIAIVVNVSEGSLDQLADPASAANPGRVVFYSGDVEEGQAINQSFGPVFGPVRWNGNPLTIDVTVIELDDRENARMKGMLSALARLGGSVSGIGAGQVLNVLNRVGSALVESNRDDVMGRYRLTLAPGEVSGNTHLPALMEGDLVLLRAAQRDQPIVWEKRGYDPATGLLAIADAGSNRTPNYLAFTITRNLGTADQTPSAKLADLLSVLEKSPSVSAAQATATALLTEWKRDADYRQAVGAIQTLAAKGNSELLRRRAAGGLARTLQCAAAAQEATGATNADNGAITARCGENWKTDAFTPQEFNALARMIGGLDCAPDIGVDALLGKARPVTGEELTKAGNALTTGLLACKARQQAQAPAKPSDAK